MVDKSLSQLRTDNPVNTLNGTELVEVTKAGASGATTTEVFKDYVAAFISVASTSVSFTPSGNLASTNVGAALAELDSEKLAVSALDIDSGLTANSDSRVATQKATKSAIAAALATAQTNTPAGNIAATTVQGAINELDSEKLPVTAIDVDSAMSANSDSRVPSQKATKTAIAAALATAQTNTPAGNIAATTVQGAINELDSEKLAISALDTDTSLAANSDSRVATQRAVKSYVDGIIDAANGVVYKGSLDCSTNPNYPAANSGHLYIVSVAGRVGGASGAIVEVGDWVLCKVDGSASGNQATVGANWNIVQTNINGALTTSDIGVNVQAYSSNLAAWSAVNPSSYLTTSAAAAAYQPLSTILTNTTASFTSALLSKLNGIAAGATANSSDATLLSRANHTGTQLASTISDFSTAADARVSAAIGVTVQAYSSILAATTAAFTTAKDTKLSGIATGATANSSDATLLARANHTGQQAVSTISDAGILSAFRNKILNGDFDIWQRGTSQTATGYGSADRWTWGFVGSSMSVTRENHAVGQSVVPGNPTYFSRTVVTSVAGAGNYCFHRQLIEGVRTFAGKQVTITAYLQADAVKNVAFELVQIFGTGGSPSSFVSIPCGLKSVGTGFTKISFTANVPSISGKTLGTNNNDYLGLVIWYEAGSSFNTRASNLGQQSGTFDLSHVSIVEGDATGDADPFSPRHIQQELILCQRYYRKSTSTNIFSGEVISGNTYNCGYPIVPPMRAVPTVVLTHSGTPTNFATTSGTSVVSADGIFEARVATGTGAGRFRSDATMDAEL